MDYDVIVVGAGHAGCEAALAAARMGARTLLLTMSLDLIAQMPCNPSIGGPGKGHLVCEIDALGGQMARTTDDTFIQIRLLNQSKGPAVQALRAQADKRRYSQAMKHALESQPGLHLKQATVERLLVAGDRVRGVVTGAGRTYPGRTVILTTGTFLAGRILAGEQSWPAGRAGELPALGLAACLRELGFPLARLQTNTPPRVDARTIDFSQTEIQPGSPAPLYFSADYRHPPAGRGPGPAAAPRPGFLDTPPNPAYPGMSSPWRPQLPCYAVYTTPQTLDIVRANLHRSPIAPGKLDAAGPRYCPSFEEKVVRFPHKERHQLFLEPEGWHTGEVYVQGLFTGLPEEVQLEMLHSIPALREAEIMRPGYAIEYDSVPCHELTAGLETRRIGGLFHAGQINGTSGYEEAAAQGLMAGINAALQAQGRPPLLLRRDQAYIGVLIDDLITKDIVEPYRMLTSRAEYRLLLRQDNAGLRLGGLGYELGLVSAERHRATEDRRAAVRAELERLAGAWIKAPAGAPPPAALRSSPGLWPPPRGGAEEGAEEGDETGNQGHSPPPGAGDGREEEPGAEGGINALQLLRRPGVEYDAVARLSPPPRPLPAAVAEQVSIEAKYAGYIERQAAEVARARRLEDKRLPAGLRYETIPGLRAEAREKLAAVRPATVGQAGRLAGVNPADISVLLIHLKRLEPRGPSPEPGTAAGSGGQP